MIDWRFALVLAGYCIAREVYYLYAIQKLVNKLMSRNYHEYQIAESQGKLRKQDTRLKVDDDLPEDMGGLQGIM